MIYRSSESASKLPLGERAVCVSALIPLQGAVHEKDGMDSRDPFDMAEL